MCGVGTVNLVENCLRFIRYSCLSFTLDMICFIKKYKFSLVQNIHVHDIVQLKKMDSHVLMCNTNLFKKIVINMGIGFTILTI